MKIFALTLAFSPSVRHILDLDKNIRQEIFQIWTLKTFPFPCTRVFHLPHSFSHNHTKCQIHIHTHAIGLFYIHYQANITYILNKNELKIIETKKKLRKSWKCKQMNLIVFWRYRWLEEEGRTWCELCCVYT